MTTVAQIIASKGSALPRTTPDATIAAALAAMARHEVDGLVVMEGEALVGIFTSNDYLRKIVGQGADAGVLTVGDVMTRNVATVDPATSTVDCVSTMNRGRFRHLPVKDGDRLVGVVTMLDIMRFNAARAADQDLGAEEG
jgi:CBS domain-containing protein